MKEIVFISGKGGTGKTSITAAIAYKLHERCLLADCDVDAADMHLLTRPQQVMSERFFSGVLARIDREKCSNCGICKRICRFHAISSGPGYQVDPLFCEGCGYCHHVCPERAISLIDREVGDFSISRTRFGNILVHAELDIGAENSGKLVSKVKKEAKILAKKDDIEFILVDGSPGIGCPVISSLSGADYVVLVTEPTLSAFHDLKRVDQLAEQFRLDCGCIINKSDLNPAITKQVKDYLVETGISLLAMIPYDQGFTRAMIEGKTVHEISNEKISAGLLKAWQKIEKNLEGEEL